MCLREFAGDTRAGTVSLMVSVDEDQRRYQRLRYDRVVDPTSGPCLDPHIRRKPDKDLTRNFVLAAGQHIAFDVIAQVR